MLNPTKEYLVMHVCIKAILADVFLDNTLTIYRNRCCQCYMVTSEKTGNAWILSSISLENETISLSFTCPFVFSIVITEEDLKLFSNGGMIKEYLKRELSSAQS